MAPPSVVVRQPPAVIYTLPPSVVYTPAPPVVYAQPPAVVYPPAYGLYRAYWFSCRSYGAYYPTVQSCPKFWVAVPATP